MNPAMHAVAWIRLIAALAVVLGACRGRDDLDGQRRPIPGVERRVAEYSLSLSDSRVVLDLLDNRAAALVHAGGALIVECGTPDMAKYAEGAYRSPWHMGRDGGGGQRAALVNGVAGEIYFPIDRDRRGVETDRDGAIEIALQARAAEKRQLVSVFLNEKRLGDIAMPTTGWQTYRIRAPAGTHRRGENKLRFYFRHSGEIDGRPTGAALARIRAGAPGRVDTPALRAGPVRRGDQLLSALQVDRAARLSYYLKLPSGRPAVVFAGAGPRTDLSIAIAGRPGHPAKSIWSGRTTANWTEQRVELADWAGQVVRLDLTSSGPADWGRPLLVVPSAAPESIQPEVSAGNVKRSSYRAERPGGRPLDQPDRRFAADHVIVWVVSALRADRIRRDQTPAFWQFSAHGLRFVNAYSASSAPGPAHVALLAGIHPQGGTVPVTAKTLGERFGEAGYTTALVSGNGFVNDEAGFARGFSVYHNPMRRRHPFGARLLWQKAKQILRRHREGRAFLYIVTVEPHPPYSPSADSLRAVWGNNSMPFEPVETVALAAAVAAGRTSLDSAERGFVAALYDGEVRDADAAFGAMLHDLDELGIRDRTAVILVGDHGAELWEHDGLGHGRHLHREVLHVPLAISLPAEVQGADDRMTDRIVERDVSLVDLHATVLDLAGLAPSSQTQGASLLGPEVPAGDARQRSVRSKSRPRGHSEASELRFALLAGASGRADLPQPVFAHLPGVARSLQLGRYKLVVPLRAPRMMFDLLTDPGETADLIGQAPVIERYMRNVFGLGVAYQSAWTRRRWGRANNLMPAFAHDHRL
ncbi:MAG: sulfatase [Proteobacteria bacterium]|nr:sulfatase [Pseudomonadota bacterium]